MAEVTPLDALERLAGRVHCRIAGGLHLEAPSSCGATASERGLPEEQTLYILSPQEPQFWEAFCAASESMGPEADPYDAFTRRLGAQMQAMLPEAEVIYPFGGPPYAPIYDWACQSGRIFPSPLRLLVDHEAGLMVSIRMVLRLNGRLPLPPRQASPCARCISKPCLSQCPVGAFLQGEVEEGYSQGDNGQDEALNGDFVAYYDVPRCKDFLSTPEGQSTCLSAGCLARRACPFSQGSGRDPAQSGFHMRAFLAG